MKTIGLVGVGTMGAPMGESLLRAGFALRVCAHRRRDRVERLVAAGAVEAADPAAVADGCDALITMVPDSPQVEEALFGARGAAHGLRAGSYVIDMSTISPVASRGFNERLSAQGVAMLDAPVSGGPARAADGDRHRPHDHPAPGQHHRWKVTGAVRSSRPGGSASAASRCRD